MYPGCVRWVLSHAARTVCGVNSVYRTPARLKKCGERCNILAASWSWSPLCTAADNTVQPPAPKKKKQGSEATSVTSVGRKVPQRQIQVISESGEDLGIMSRADVFRKMDQQGLRLVLLTQNKDAPVYKLMSGKQIHEEQLKQRTQKKAAAVQVKELTLSLGIAAHDLTNKLKQVESWLEKQHHVRITLRSGRATPDVSLDTTLEQMLQQMEVMVGFVSQPKVIRDGKAAMCVVRQPSAKELAKKQKSKAVESKSEDQTPRNTATDNNRDLTEEPRIQQ
ncbi:translation initiation factor IF-3, mitochondrial [Parambassis ranga]|uniref:Translation initiation factor IF-3, mitochondrial n=1 Tax=Parambassis ranga TaxID=210632 RepID=A0A6P7HII3_9TELE|nr:translation initiation factor IF-3, mitochondrial [Parambassis ranga]